MKPLTELEKLASIKARTGDAWTLGLNEEKITKFLGSSEDLRTAISVASERFDQLIQQYPELENTSEEEIAHKISAGFLNFYPDETKSPYIPLASKGPWIISTYGAVIYDTGGYGMIGHGHNPDAVLEMMTRPYVMANIMTPSFSQIKFDDAIRSKIGYHRPEKECPFDRFICMNSGSEAMAVATRISDARAKKMTDPGGRHEGKESRFIVLTKSFHGRTSRPARISNSTRKRYSTALASYREMPEQYTVTPNDTAHLQFVWDRLIEEGFYIEAIVLEPVMGEGNPGVAIERDFYDLARKLTHEHGSLLLVDSIQAGLRAQGVVSIVDYPDFLDCTPPDMESYSKALNGGQFPLSVLALSKDAAEDYVTGTYGNTMTANPRGLAIGRAVLDSINPALTENVRERGVEFVEKLKALAAEVDGLITDVQGTGLLVSAELDQKIAVVHPDGAEQRMRRKGVNVIHGGQNALRFTPWFHMSSEEIDLICEITKETILELAT